MKKILALALALLSAFSLSIACVANEEVTQTATFNYGTPVIDGVIGDDWKAATVIKSAQLLMDNPSLEAEVSENVSVEIRGLWDEKYLYLAYDFTGPINPATDIDVDAPIYQNNCSVAFFDPFMTGKSDDASYFWFGVHPKDGYFRANNDTVKGKIAADDSAVKFVMKTKADNAGYVFEAQIDLVKWCADVGATFEMKNGVSFNMDCTSNIDYNGDATRDARLFWSDWNCNNTTENMATVTLSDANKAAVTEAAATTATTTTTTASQTADGMIVFVALFAAAALTATVVIKRRTVR